jgi:hypothetical protein
MSKGLNPSPDVILTGGASMHMAELLQVSANDSVVRHMPHLVLSGIALVAP